MKKKRKKAKSSSVKARLEKASGLLHDVWDVLEPSDISEKRWGDLRNVITSVLAALRK